jgi:hypothetical protein
MMHGHEKSDPSPVACRAGAVLSHAAGAHRRPVPRRWLA